MTTLFAGMKASLWVLGFGIGCILIGLALYIVADAVFKAVKKHRIGKGV